MKRSFTQNEPERESSSTPSEHAAESGAKREMLDYFPVLSYFKIPILCIPPCYWPFSWPRLRRKRGRRSDLADYLDYEEGTVEKRLNKVAARQFLTDNDLRGFAPMRYLPEAKNGVVRLIYLTTIRSVSDHKHPYTRRTKDIFSISEKADFWTMLCLNLAMVFVPLFGLAALFSALTFIQAWNADELTLIPAALAAFCGAVSGILGVVATGTNPHFASVAANERQNTLVELESDFASLAIDLLKLYDSDDRATHDFARRIARGLKMGVLQDLLAKHTDWNLAEPLREAKRFILHKNVCFHSTIIRTYLTQEHRHQITRRKALSKAQNYFMKLRIPSPPILPAAEDDGLSSAYGSAEAADSDSETDWEEGASGSAHPPPIELQSYLQARPSLSSPPESSPDTTGAAQAEEAQAGPPPVGDELV